MFTNINSKNINIKKLNVNWCAIRTSINTRKEINKINDKKTQGTVMHTNERLLTNQTLKKTTKLNQNYFLTKINMQQSE